jgi:hypothetical protein
VTIGRPIETKGLSVDDRDRLIGQVRSAIEQMLER